MNFNKHGYASSAVIFRRIIREMREHVEYEKFVARTIKDDERTRKFKDNTQNHQNAIHRMNYNNERAELLTAAGKKKAKYANE